MGRKAPKRDGSIWNNLRYKSFPIRVRSQGNIVPSLTAYMANKSRSIASRFVGSFGRGGEPVQFISSEPGARKKARQFARLHGGRIYRAVAVGRALTHFSAIDLGRGYIVANKPPIEFVYWGRYYAKVMEIKDMSKTDRLQYIYACGLYVFEDRQKFRRWLQSPIPALGLKKPADLIKTASGTQMVHDALFRIEYSVLA